MNESKEILNIGIIAHIDAGKSTLTSTILSNIYQRNITMDLIDSLKVEQKRNITVKSQCFAFEYGNKQINLIDMPGHCEFSAQVEIYLDKIDVAILLIDALKGIEAQTINNYESCMKYNKKIIICINKIDAVDKNVIEIRKSEIYNFFKTKIHDIITISAKQNLGINDLLNVLLKYDIKKDISINHKIIDLYYDIYKGISILLKVGKNGIYKGDYLFYNLNKKIQIQSIYKNHVELKYLDMAMADDIVFINTNIKNPEELKYFQTKMSDVNINDFGEHDISNKLLFACNLFPKNAEQLNLFFDSIVKIQYNDRGFYFEEISENIFGRGIKLFLSGKLHLEIIKDRLMDEYCIETFDTEMQIKYKIKMKNELEVFSFNKFYNKNEYMFILEPYVNVYILIDRSFDGGIYNIIYSFRGHVLDVKNVDQKISLLIHLPLDAIGKNVKDVLLSSTSGHISLTYDPMLHYVKSNVVFVSYTANNNSISIFDRYINVNESKSEIQDKISILETCFKKQQYEIIIRGNIDGRCVLTKRIKPFRKDVIAKCYGGDQTRKNKLLKKQAEGKKKIKSTSDMSIDKSMILENMKKK